MSAQGLKIEFTILDHSLVTLKKATEDGQFRNMAECLSEALSVYAALQEQAALGYRQVLVSKPGKNKYRELEIPRLGLVPRVEK